MKKPEEAVLVLLSRLGKAKEDTLQRISREAGNSLDSKFKEIEQELLGMKDWYPMINRWEKIVMDQFCELEKKLQDLPKAARSPPIFKEGEDEITIISRKLNFIKYDITQLRGRLTLMMVNVMWYEKDAAAATEDSGNVQTIPLFHKYWVDLGIEDKINESNGMSRLLASYHRLESHPMKMCLLSLSIFPENSEIKKRCLIYWWIGDGIVAKTKDQTAEVVGEQLFQQLLDEGFIKPTTTSSASSNWSTKSFFVSPWIRRMLIRAAEENRYLELTSRRRMFLRGENDSYGIKGEDLLTVFNVEEQYLGMRAEWLMQLRNVEVLQMGRWQNSTTHHIEVKDQEVSLLDGLGSQKKLKYLSLRGISRIEALPASIAKLISLQIIDLRACHNLEELPQEISELTNLTHLDVSECYLLESMPKGLQHLLHLQVLKGFVIGKAGRNSCRISDLARLSKLRKLSIRVRNGQDQTNQLLNLVYLSVLEILTISFGGDVSSPIAIEHLPQSLTKLDLWCVPFNAVPLWMLPSRLPYLEKLYIRGGKLTSLDLGDADNVWNAVKFLRLEYLKDFNFKSFEIYKSSLFPKNPNVKKILVEGQQS